jgi:hypothetical protein
MRVVNNSPRKRNPYQSGLTAVSEHFKGRGARGPTQNVTAGLLTTESISVIPERFPAEPVEHRGVTQYRGGEPGGLIRIKLVHLVCISDANGGPEVLIAIDEALLMAAGKKRDVVHGR